MMIRFRFRVLSFRTCEFGLGCGFVRMAGSLAAVTTRSVESSLLGVNDDPVVVFEQLLGSIGDGPVEIQMAESHPAFGS